MTAVVNTEAGGTQVMPLTTYGTVYPLLILVWGRARYLGAPYL